MDVKRVAALANLTISSAEEKQFADQFSDTLKTVDLINQLDTSAVTPTSQVTGLINITRQDVIDRSRMLTQSAAVGQASHHQKGYFVVPAIFHEE